MEITEKLERLVYNCFLELRRSLRHKQDVEWASADDWLKDIVYEVIQEKLEEEKIYEKHLADKYATDTCPQCHNPALFLFGGLCRDCYLKAEAEIAGRSVWQHVKSGLHALLERDYYEAKHDFSWALQRLTETGDYHSDGYFEQQGHNWKGAKCQNT